MHDPTELLNPNDPADNFASQVGVFPSVTIILPAFNEELAIGSEILRLREALNGEGIEHELIVVDDGSKDQTAVRALVAGARILKHVGNRGYGASLKTGILAAAHDIIVITDADGTYPAEDIPTLLRVLEQADMVVGARTGANVNIPLIRRAPKWVLGRLANRPTL